MVLGGTSSGFDLGVLPEGAVSAVGFLKVLYGVLAGQALCLARPERRVEQSFPVPAGSKGARDPWLDLPRVI